MPKDTYESKVNWLFNQFPVFQKQGESAYKPTLDNTFSIMQYFDIPIEQMKFIHVAGTNGKGTTSSIIASALTSSGSKVGLFTSPHIKDFRERIRVNGEMTSQDFVFNFIEKIQNASFAFAPSFFEITWVMAIVYFYQQECDIVVVETGLGGRLDATNVITPELSVITNIGLDHVNILGDSREKIAFEKAGIIKNGIPVFIGEKDDETSSVFIDVAKSRRAPITFVESSIDASIFDINKNLAFKVIDFLLKDVSNIEDLKIQGINNLYANTGLFGRSQVYSTEPLIIVDAAHNLMGIQRLIQDIQKKYPEKRLRVLYGASNDKDLEEIAKLFPQEWLYYFTEFDSKRTTKLEDFKKNNSISKLKAKYFTNAKEAFLEAQSIDLKDDMLIVFGSFFLLEEII